ncbi:MAG TPA: glycosyltransferase [Solirubrobacteraceae bacterium]|nr:glycosyltransferase [Solirubrobacteraceae bacterium]
MDPGAGAGPAAEAADPAAGPAAEPAAGPAISVVVPSHDRPLRLRWLLNALEDQTLDRNLWEVVVCHDSRGPETGELLRGHPLAAAGLLRELTIEAGHGPGIKRNRAWRAARAPLIAFTDDDCRPPPEWLAGALAAALANPGGIVQGRTQPDPDELGVLHAGPRMRSQEIDPPVLWSQTCNIVYPRAVLDAVGGFDDELDWVEDVELACRARDAGAPYVGAAEVLTYHAVDSASLRAVFRAAWRWRDLPGVVAAHPELRSAAAGCGYFWKPRHAGLALALAGLATRRPLVGAVAAIPWALEAMPPYGSSVRGRVRSLSELPMQAALDLVEFAGMVAGSVRHRTVFL